MFGKKLKAILTGSAPINGEILDFFKIICGCPVFEGYGLTETTAGSFFSSKYDSSNGIFCRIFHILILNFNFKRISMRKE